MFCPKCRAEYRQGFTMCSECGVPLVEAVSSKQERNGKYVEMAEIQIDRRKIDAMYLLSILDGEGIAYHINDRRYDPLSPRDVPLKLKVEKTRLKEVREIIDEIENENDESEENYEFSGNEASENQNLPENNQPKGFEKIHSTNYPANNNILIKESSSNGTAIFIILCIIGLVVYYLLK